LQANTNGLPQANGHPVEHGAIATSYDILLTRQANNGYLARPVLMPELVVAGKDEQEALALLQQAIVNQVTENRLLRIEVPASESTVNDPWLRFAGEWGDEAEWAQFQADIAANRQLLEQQMQTTEAE